MSLKNKVAIVTGGNSGIGQAIVLELARQGASIVIDYVVHPEATEKLEQQMCEWLPSSKLSPDRLDALVHGLTWLRRTERVDAVIEAPYSVI